MTVPPSPEVRVAMLVAAGWTRDHAQRFVDNTPHTATPVEVEE
jgi:hypothetical protein